MTKIELFPIPDQHFRDLKEFNKHLLENYDPPSVDHALTIIIALTNRNEDDFLITLKEFGFSFERELGKVYHIKYKLSEETLEAYLSYDPETGIVIFYTNFRKTEEVSKIKDFLYNDIQSYPLFFRPSVMDQLLTRLSSSYEDFSIIDFTAKRYLGQKDNAQIRPECERTFSYWGNDGRETLLELRYQYGVIPTRMIIECPGVIKFGLDSRGYFTFYRGDFEILMSVMQIVIDESRKTMKAFNNSSFSLLSVQTSRKEFPIPVSSPVLINLKRKLVFSDLQDVDNLLKSSGFLVINEYAEEGSLYLSYDIVLKTSHRFRIKANENKIKIFPDGVPCLSPFMEFYEFILNSIDPDAELII